MQQLRGPGDIEGTMQSGIASNLRIANLGSDGQIPSTSPARLPRQSSLTTNLQTPQNRILAER